MFTGTSESFLLKSESLSSLTEGELRFRCDSDAASDISSVQVRELNFYFYFINIKLLVLLHQCQCMIQVENC